MSGDGGGPHGAYAARLEELGLRDVRPLYRELLTRLREEDPAAYEEAVRRYEEEVDTAAPEAEDPVATWLRYGAWLAGRLVPGRPTAVDASGRARDVELGPDDRGGAERRAPAAEQLDITAAATGPDAGGDEGTGGRAGTGGGPGSAGGGAGAAGPQRPDEPGEEGPVPRGSLLLHLPDDDRRPALALAVPGEPTEHQEATRDLLCG